MKSRYPVGEVILYVIRRLDGDLQGSVVRRSGPMGDDAVRVRTARMGAIEVHTASSLSLSFVLDIAGNRATSVTNPPHTRTFWNH